MVVMKSYSSLGRTENQTITITVAFVWIRMGTLAGVGLILLVQREGNSSVSEVGIIIINI